MRFTLSIATIFVCLSLIFSWFNPVAEKPNVVEKVASTQIDIPVDSIGVIRKHAYPTKEENQKTNALVKNAPVNISESKDDGDNNNVIIENNDSSETSNSMNKGDASKFDKYSGTIKLFNKFKYVGNMSSMIFHVTDGSCEKADKMKPANIHEVKSIEQARAEKFTPCGICLKELKETW